MLWCVVLIGKSTAHQVWRPTGSLRLLSKVIIVCFHLRGGTGLSLKVGVRSPSGVIVEAWDHGVLVPVIVLESLQVLLV